MTDYEKRVYESIPYGAKHAIDLSTLADVLCVSPRQVRKIIENLVYNDHPVCNLRHGYFRPQTYGELEAYCNIIRAYKCKFNKKEYRLRKALEHFAIYPIDSHKSEIKRRGRAL
ncbi:MAG: hypothetical protein RRY08_06690 [Christensenella sp.]